MAKFLKISVLGALCFAYALVFAEGFLRLFDPQPIIPRYVTAAPYGVRMNIPDAQYRQITAETRISVKVNEQGFRANKTYPLEKPQGVARIALFGDSYFMGYEVNLEDSFAWRLEQELRAMWCPVEVINFAVSGFGTAEMLRTLDKKGFTFDPDLVIFQWHHTDPADNQRAGLYRLEDNNLVSTGIDYIPATGLRTRLNAVPFYKEVSENSHLYAAAREKLARTIKDVLTGGALVKQPTAPRQTTEARTATTTLDQPDRPAATPLDIALLSEAENISRAQGASFFVVDIPSFHARTSFSSSFRLLPSSLTQTPAYITPVNIFRANAAQDKKLYWEKGHYHLTPTGNRLLAEHVANRLYNRASKALQCQ